MSLRIFFSMAAVALFSALLAASVSIYLGFYVIREDIKTALLQSGIELQRLAADFREDQERERWFRLQQEVLPYRMGRLLRILDGSRNLIFSNFQNDQHLRLVEQMDLANVGELVFIRTDTGGYVFFKSNFRNHSGKSRELQLAMPLPVSQDIFRKAFVYSVPTLLLTLLFVLMVSSGLSRRLLRPVMVLANHLDSLKDKEVREWTLVPLRAQSELFGQIINKANDLISLVQESDVFRQNWARSIAHEIRTPLMLMHGELETFDIENATKAELESFHNQLTNDIMRMENIVRTVLALGKRSHSEGVQLKKVRFVGRLEEAIQEFRRAFQLAIQLKVDQELKNQTSEVRVDWDLLRILLDNLVRNIVFHAGPKVKIEIYVSETRRHFEIQVADSGIGFPDETLRVLKNWKSWDSRLGVGLNLSKQIEALSGWKLSFENRKEGGALVQVQIPKVEYWPTG